MLTTQELLERIAKFDWFSQVGKPINLDINIPYTQIFSWQEAEAWCKFEATEYILLNAKNDLTMHLSKYCRIEYREWNTWIDKTDTLFDTNILPLVEKHFSKFNSQESFHHHLKWQLGISLMEIVYRDCHSPPTFFQSLIDIYEAGHFPCGWEGEWPEGNLVIF